MLSSPLLLAVMSVSFLWVSGCCFLESLGHCTAVLLVWFPRSESVSDPHTWGEVFLIGDVCDSTSFLRLILVVLFLCISIQWVTWGCRQTTSGIGGSSVVSGLSIAAPEWRRGIFSLIFGLQHEQLHSSLFDWLFVGPDSIFLVFCAGEAVCWLHLLHSKSSLWSGLFSHMSLRVDN